MARWTLPLGRFYQRSYIGLLIIYFIFNILGYFSFGLTGVLITMGLSTLVVSLAYLLMKWRLGDLHDYTVSRWRMDKDQVLRRLAQAMAARGVKPQLETKDERVLFLLPPMNIIVDRARWVTLVFVGPSTEETELLVERLEGFVEQALA